MSVADGRDAVSSTGWLRLGIGLVQGLAAWLLIEASKQTLTEPRAALLAALDLIVAFTPLLALAGLGRMRPRVLIVWCLVAALLLGGLAFYDLWREPLERSGTTIRKWPSPQLILFGAAALYIAHHLIEPADVERRWWPSYQGRFDSAWRHGFQLALALAFTGVFWGVLRLGATLFGMIGIRVLQTLLREAWFIAPATGVVFAAAVHLTDVRPALIRGVRTVGMTLLSWILPLMAGLTVLFLLALVFTGLRPLWSTRWAAALLLSAAAVLIVLINAAYQDGSEPEGVSPILRWAGRAAALALVPLAALAAWATGLRIGQYGLTPERIASVAVVCIAALYAVGYAWAAAIRGPWMRRIETVNVLAAVAMLAIILGLFSPLADPARLSVADQIRRLQAGRTPPEKFDFAFLRFNAARFGRDALAGLARSPQPRIATLARNAQAAANRHEVIQPATTPFSAATVHPAGAMLPDSFRRQIFRPGEVGAAQCLTGDSPCDLFMLDVNGDAAPEVLVASGSIASTDVFVQNRAGRWTHAGRYNRDDCRRPGEAPEGLADSLGQGGAVAIAPQFRDLQLGEERLNFERDNRC